MGWSLQRPSSIEAFKVMVIRRLEHVLATAVDDPLTAVRHLELLTAVLPEKVRLTVASRIAPLREELQRLEDKLPSVLTSEEEAMLYTAYEQLVKEWLSIIIDSLAEHGFILWEREIEIGEYGSIPATGENEENEAEEEGGVDAGSSEEDSSLDTRE